MKTHPRTGLTVETIRKRFDYDPTTGQFTWRLAYRGKAAGAPAGTFDGRYRHINFECRSYYCHVLAWAFIHGNWPVFDLDHVDENKQNNAIWNIRPTTRSQNSQNTKKTRGRSKYRGVSWHAAGGKWQAGIAVNSVKIFLGLYVLELEAAQAYAEAAAKYHTRNPHAANLQDA